MSSPFGFLLPPSAPLAPPDLQCQTISPNQLAYTIPAAAIKTHLAVFLLPGQTLPPGAAAALYIQFPGQEFRFLGALGEGKASAIFRVSGMKTGSNGASGMNGAGAPEVDMDASDEEAINGHSITGDVVIGISLEPAGEVVAKVAAQKQGANGDGGDSRALVRRTDGGAAAVAVAASQPSTKVLAQRIIQNAFNFLASFEGGNGMVPIKAFEGWWQKFERRVQNDPSFLNAPSD